MNCSLPLLLALALPFAALAQSHPQRPWTEDVMYFALTDRFHDGDPANNIPAGSDPALYDPAQAEIGRYHGGDFRGLELALKSGYFKDLGVTALWITPPVRNVWYSGSDLGGPKTGYHGYWAQDFLDIDPHLVSRRSLDESREYADSRDGRMEHYRDFVALAHEQGIKVIQDIVCNHAGPVFYYDVNGNGRFDIGRKEEWTRPFKRKGLYENARWADEPKWNLRRTAPFEALTVLGREVKMNGVFGKLESYGRKGMSPDSLGKATGEEIECDFFSLRDFWTQPGSAHFEQLVDEFVETYAFYVEAIGVDGFRIDTVKHVHHPFWDAFTERLRKRVGPERASRLLLFGEVYDGNPVKLGQYTYRSDWPQRREPCLDAVLHFDFCFSARDYLRKKGAAFGTAQKVEKALATLSPTPRAGAARAIFNQTPGSDGLHSAQKSVNFIENHDGLNRFRVAGISERRNLLATALTMLAPGIPCLYYGTEAGLEDKLGKLDQDSETGRLTFVGAADADRFEPLRKSGSFQAIARISALRRENPALLAGETTALWVDRKGSETDDGVFAFARGGGAVEPLLIVFNASNQERAPGVAGAGMKLVSAAGKPLFQPGDKLERLPIAGMENKEPSGTPYVEVSGSAEAPQIELRVGPESVAIYRKAR